MVPSNPFSTFDGQNFPDFSPIFTKSRTPINTERNSSFRWSIDHISRLKPAQIDTDAATLVKTNGHSPEDDVEEQKAIDRFFSQRTILPSPWPMVQTKALPKRVTFSPLPPAMAYIREDSLVESELRDSKTADAGTQTVLTIPLNCDLEGLLGSAFYQPEEENNRDLGNTSLRRKLFGKPEKQQLGQQSEHMEVSPNLSPVRVVEGTPAEGTPYVYSSSYSTGSLSSSTPLHPSHVRSSHLHPGTIPTSMRSSSTGTSLLWPGKEGDANPPASSLLLHSPDEKLPEFSPIGSSEFCSVSSHPGQEGTRDQPSWEPLLVTPCKTSISATRHSDTSPSFPILSPITGDASGSPMASPMTVSYPPLRPGYKASPMVAGGRQPRSSGKATSTPNTAVMKRQLAASPFASPVLKQPRRKRPEAEQNEDKDYGDENSDSEELAQPLSLADLKTETYDFTNVTATTCTSYFTQMGLDEDRESKQPLHSTATSSHHSFHPPAHSTMVASHHIPTAPPNLQPASQYPSPSCTDSGVAASVEFNITNILGSTAYSNSQTQSLQFGSGEELRKQGTPALLKSHHSVSKQPDLSTIEEGEPPTDGMPGQDVEAVAREGSDVAPSQMDSGLAFSPEVYLSKAETASETQKRHVAFPHDLAKCTPSPIKLKLHSQKYASLLAGHSAASRGTFNTVRTTPSRHSNVTTDLAPFAPRFPHDRGKFTTKSSFQSTVLPSRLKLYPTLSLPLTFSLPGSALSYAPGGNGSTITSINSTTPNRRFRLGSTHKLASLPSFPEAVLRKKQTFKSRLQFNSPIKSAPSSFSSSSAHLHSPACEGFTTSSNSWNCNRSPLGDAALNFPCPTTPLSSNDTRFNHRIPSAAVHIPSSLETRLWSPFQDENRAPSCNYLRRPTGIS